MIGAQEIYEDACIFEAPFPTPKQDMLVGCDAWKSSARLYNIKGKILDQDDDLDTIVSCTLVDFVYMLI